MRASASNASSNGAAPMSASGRTAQRPMEAATGSEAVSSAVAGSADAGTDTSADAGGSEQPFSSALAAVRAAGGRRNSAPSDNAALICERVDPRAPAEAGRSDAAIGNGVPEGVAIKAPDPGRTPTATRHGKRATDSPKRDDVAPAALAALLYPPASQSPAAPSAATAAVGSASGSAAVIPVAISGAAVSGGAISGAAVIDAAAIGAAVADAAGGASPRAGGTTPAAAQASSEEDARSPRISRDASAKPSAAQTPIATAGHMELAARAPGAPVVTADSLNGSDTSGATSRDAARDASHDAGRDTASGSGGSGSSTVLLAPSPLAPVSSPTPIAPPSAAMAVQALGTPVSDSGWPYALAAQIQWMASRQMHSATLRLSPEHLGPLEVRIEVAHAQVNVNFSAHHPDTREALAQAVPRLRELFAGSGLNLGQATVQQEPRSSGQSPQDRLVQPQLANKTVEPVANTVVHRLGLIDEYA